MLGDVESTLRSELAASGSEAAFWNRVARSGTPRIDHSYHEHGDDQVHVTFLLRRHDAPFRVYIDASSLTDHHGSELTTMRRLDDTGIWFWDTQASRTWRGSYRFMPVSEDVAATLDPPGIADTLAGVRSRFMGLLEHAIPDEYCRLRFGDASVAEMPDAPEQRWWKNDSASPSTPQAVPRHLLWHSTVLGNTRDVWIHETGEATPQHSTADRPLVIVLDGDRWVHDAPLAPVLDRATAEGQLPPAVFVFVHTIDNDVRGEELPCNRAFWDAVFGELVPLAASALGAENAVHAPFTSDPRRTVAAGQSYGGLASLFAALEYPDRVSSVSSQSGSFWWPVMSYGEQRGPAGGRIAEMLSAGPPSTMRVDMTVGTCEGDMLRHNAHIRDLLQSSGVQVRYGEFDGGHEWLCWRSELVESLVRLLEEPEDPADETTGDNDHDDGNQNEEQDR